MKKNVFTGYRRTITVGMLMLSMMTVSIPVNRSEASAATTKQAGKSKISINASEDGTILTGESRTLTIKNVKKKSIKKLTVSATKKSVASVKKDKNNRIVIQSKKVGNSTVYIKLLLKNKMKYNLKYKVVVADTVDRKVKLIKMDGNKSSMKLRFFKDTPHIPYVHLTDFYSQLSGGKTLTVEEKGTGGYLITTPQGDTATINTDTDVLESDEFFDFQRVYPPEEGDVAINSDYGGAPFLEALPDEVISPGKHYTLKYSDYGMDLLGEKNDIWFPFETAANTFMTGFGASISYSGVKLYHYTDLRKLGDLKKTDFYNEYLSMYPKGKRPADIVDYSYRELMLLLDIQYGNPGRCYFSDAIQKKGMDWALSETDDMTRGVKNLLKSTSLMDYYMGLGILQDMLYDGGHTMLDENTYYLYAAVKGLKDNTYQAYYSDLLAEADKIGYKPVNILSDAQYWDTYHTIKKTKGWEDFDYHEQGDTAVYSMGSMEVDADAWKAYYEKGGEIPKDTYGYFIRSLNKASENKAIKNFVIDLTSNLGGDTNVLSGMMWIMAGDASTYFTLRKTDKTIKCPFNVDSNLDGKFDEKDKEVKYPFRFAVLTSKCSFSCGNLLPFVAQSHGIMVLGERSGGGACAINSPAMGDGVPCFISSSMMSLTKDGGEVDMGVTPDKVLEIKKDADGKDDYSAFFDISALSKYINEFYAK